MKLNRLTHLYVEELKDLYSAENQLVKALPKMARASTSGDLRAGFEGYLEQTKEHVARLEKIFKALGESPNGKKCKHGGPHQRRRRTDRGRSRARGIGCRAYLRRSAGGALRSRRLRLCQLLRKDSRRRPGRVAPEADSRGREGDRQEADSTGGPDQHRGRQLRGIGCRQQVGKSREDQGGPSIASRVVEQFKRRNRNEEKSYQITTIDAGFRLAGSRRVADGHASPAESRKPADGARQHQEKQGSDKPYRRPTEDQSFGPRHHTENPKSGS